ncbi:AraC family transcriptional regulator [Marinomonas mediterranea]|uniref:AraC family transcriptional regulator n=1 Tax=Marinomonas mediterranea TaxID=119864 RepID=UPI00234BA972|nr:AraC family transcriptional regulator [Marinomonas mediterranea]WCN10981.1 AraC family transcriptional regulator [Marinomonas mediterranea]
MTPTTQPLFWRDTALPFVELRHIIDGHKVRYVPHSHEQWSIGAILGGESAYLCADRIYDVAAGDLVIMNPQLVHACNPKVGSPWSYYMLHVDCDWLAKLLHRNGVRSTPSWEPSQTDWLTSPDLFERYKAMAEILFSEHGAQSDKTAALESFLCHLFESIDKAAAQESKLPVTPNKLARVANYLLEHCHLETPIEDIADQFGYSASYLTRQFKQYYKMTPHAYRLNRRIQLGQLALKNGVPIAEVANAFGFSDQAHFQRVFKERVAATPNQYRSIHR